MTALSSLIVGGVKAVRYFKLVNPSPVAGLPFDVLAQVVEQHSLFGRGAFGVPSR